MIRLTFVVPAGDQEWDDWTTRTANERDRMLQEEFGPKQINDRLYKAQRDRLLAATHKKCAYCETYLPPGERKGDVEHYRPKGRVRDRYGKVVRVKRAGVEMNHPGYYWLAYDYKNLLPNCGACNRRARDAASGRLTGKSDIFPTLNDLWACEPGEVESEQPALLNPWLDDPSVHLAFDPDTGLVIGRTERGKETVELLGLNRDGLPEERKAKCEDVRRYFLDTVAAVFKGQKDELAEQRIHAIRDGSAQYAAICRQALLRSSEELDKARQSTIGLAGG
jgi:hypothetical protein